MSVQEKIDQLTNNSFGGTATNERLKISGFLMDDGPHGVRFASQGSGSNATAFPTGIAMAATWDEIIGEKVGQAMGIEFWAFNRTQQLGPCIDIARDPRGGRTAESGGEDPYLAGKMGTAVAKGIQKNPIIAIVKHFVGESKQQNRHNMNVLLENRWLYDFAGYNYRKVVQDAGVMSIMGAYNLLNGDKCCESINLLSNVLRKAWGFPFYVVSDWDAIWNSQKAIYAGTDVCMGSSRYKDDLPELVRKGDVTVQALDEAVRNVLRTKILSGMLDDHRPVGNPTYAKTDKINAVNLLAAQKSVILLKNEVLSSKKNILPIAKESIKIALIGPNAEAKNLNCFGSSETFPPYSISIKEGIENKIGKNQLFVEKGCDINSERTDGFEAAKAIAAKADVVIFAGGLDATQEGEGYDWGTDRKGGSVALPQIQQRLINELAIINPNIVLVVQSGGICSLNNCLSNVKGLVYSFYAAQEAGRAIADVLFGDYNPAGRMPVSMPKKDEDIPSWEEDSFRRFSDYFGFGYRWFDQMKIQPEFAFGFGLSYSKFEYTKIIAPKTVSTGQPFSVSVEVRNISDVQGEEVVQLYVSAPSEDNVWMPVKELRGFKRISLQPGEKKKITFAFCADDFYHWDEKSNAYSVQNGTYKVMIGGASDNLVLSKSIQFINSTPKPDLVITQVYTMPRYPAKGDKVSFYALVKNQGNAVADKPFGIKYLVDNKMELKELKIKTTILPGQVKLIHSSAEITSKFAQKSTISAKLISNKSLNEWDIKNNMYVRKLNISE
ncbi:MAG: glycoside hydrolase family 3 C-terminal domain-containing protein [Paludibacteraceae bacterium]|nr:glycoside hydrolase family 3 C-terminal domain-containing protein [Paludibacteraceae bacterium]